MQKWMSAATLCALALAVVAFALPASGQSVSAVPGPQVFSNRADFLAALGDRTPVIEGFEGFPTTEVCVENGIPLVTTWFNVTSTPTDNGTSFLCTGYSWFANDPHPTEGVNAVAAGSWSMSPWVLTFALKHRAWAVGFDLTDAAERGDIFFSTDAGQSFVMARCCLSSGNMLFFGFISDHYFTQFQLTNTGIGDGWGIDQVTLVNKHIPKPQR